MKSENKQQLSPCITSWARFALQIKYKRPTNSKKCSRVYWVKVIKRLLEDYKMNEKYKVAAILKFDEFVKK